jgi:hypothetical protein
LTDRDLGRFPDDTLFHRIARAACHAGCLPRKELYESWEVARRVRRLFRGGRVVDFGGGHGLLAHVMLLLDDSFSARGAPPPLALARRPAYALRASARSRRSLGEGGLRASLGPQALPSALVVDVARPPSHERLHRALVRTWPQLSERVRFEEGSFEEVALASSDVIVSSHACGALTDVVLDRAIAARARVAVLPCCHDHVRCDSGDLSGWMRHDLAIDAVRAMRLRQHGYRIWTRTIPAEVTPRNRLLIGQPD